MTAPMLCVVWPAGLEWQADQRRTKNPGIARLFEYLARQLDFTQVREKKRDVIARELAMDPVDITVRLQKLVAWGYVIEHGRGERGEWRLTLAWSIESESLPM